MTLSPPLEKSPTVAASQFPLGTGYRGGIVSSELAAKFVDVPSLLLYNTLINKTVRPFYPPPTTR